MSQVQSAMLMLVAATVAFVVIMYLLWRRTQPAAEPRAPRAPQMPRAAREPGESRLPRLPRRDRGAEAEAPVEISAARLARISARPPLERLTETDHSAEPPADAPLLTAERPAAEAFAPAAPEPAPPSEADKAMVSQMLESMVAQVEAEAERIERRGTEPVAVRLAPQIPPRTGEVATSWIGGRPRLDPGMAWPEIREIPGDFLGQIACAGLPADVWDHLGPRRGSLAFFIHPRDGDVAVVHVHEAGDPLDPPFPVDESSSFFAPAGGLRFGDLMPFTRHAFPEWPVDLVPVRPGDEDPRAAEAEDGDEEGIGHRLYRGGYDIADPAFHPFDWDSMTAMVDILAMRIDRFWKEVEGASPIDTQLASVERRLARHDAGEKDPLGREALVHMRASLQQLHDAAEAARTANRAARERAEEIIAIVRDSAPKMPFSSSDAAAVMEALRAIRWIKVNRKPDPEARPGAELIESLTIPLTRHHPDAPLWVHDYQSIWFDHAKHAYAADPDILSDAARTVLEPWLRDLAAREMPSIGHIPFRYVHDYDDETHVTLLELPTSGLMSWMFGDVDHLVLTLRKADLAAGRWDRPLVQVSN
ncbi:MAG: DUF1963 domain-containing protein [Sphingopyxis sp.]|uniref:DUF1963 domain-containing protein n=1 Tax=Sphingopyxis sp. TaxID=1908224 RepID=UPI003D6CECEA